MTYDVNIRDTNIPFNVGLAPLFMVKYRSAFPKKGSKRKSVKLLRYVLYSLRSFTVLFYKHRKAGVAAGAISAAVIRPGRRVFAPTIWDPLRKS